MTPERRDDVESTAERKHLRRKEDRIRRTVSLVIRVGLAIFIGHLALLHVQSHYRTSPPAPLEAADMLYVLALVTVAAVIWFAHEIILWLGGVAGLVRARFGGAEK
jgi:hypothetical protein